eukprot:2750204-Amphidinium_carterae.1
MHLGVQITLGLARQIQSLMHEKVQTTLYSDSATGLKQLATQQLSLRNKHLATRTGGYKVGANS